jgi:histidinol-phosphate/aromatic aminotransferase/cobyric acid decarboxylase-like protein
MAQEAAASLQLYSDPTCKALVETAAKYYGVALTNAAKVVLAKFKDA